MEKVKQFFADLKDGKYSLYVKIGVVLLGALVVIGGGLHGIVDYVAGAITALLVEHAL